MTAGGLPNWAESRREKRSGGAGREGEVSRTLSTVLTAVCRSSTELWEAEREEEEEEARRWLAEARWVRFGLRARRRWARRLGLAT